MWEKQRRWGLFFTGAYNRSNFWGKEGKLKMLDNEDSLSWLKGEKLVSHKF